MTIDISDNNPRISYSVAAGVTQSVFTVPFEFFDDSDLNVYVNNVLKTITTDYTVTGGDGSTGTITMSITGATGGSTILLTRGTTIERVTDFTAGIDINRAALNTQLDTLTAISADLKDKADRSLRLEDYDATANLKLPLLDDRKGKFLQFNSTTGNAEAGPNNSSLTSIADFTNEINIIGDDLAAGSYVAGGEYDFGSITVDSVGSTGSPDGFIVTVYNNLANITNVAGISSNVTTVSGISANVTSVAGVSANVTTVAGISSDVTSVSSISSDVTTAAGISSDITSVAGDASDIGAVAALETEIGALGAISSDITAVNSNSANITAVAGDATDIGAVAGSIANVNTVAGISSDITAVVADESDIGIVAANISNITSLGPISADVTTAAGNSANITTVAGNNANITTVAGDTTDINTLSAISSNITTVAGISANITSVAGISANVTTVAGDTTNIGVIATDLSGTDTIGTVSSNISDVSTVATDITNVNTVATNISSVNSFSETYRIGTSDPSTSLDTGDLFFNSSSGVLKVYDGSSWVAGVTAGSGFLALSGGTMTGTLGVTTVDFGDWTVTETGGSLYFATGGTNKMKLDASGNLEVVGNVTANATIV